MGHDQTPDHPLAAAAFFGKCWAMHPAKFDEVLSLAEALLEGKQISWPEGAAGKSGARAADEPYEVEDGVAVIRVYGVLDKRMNMFSEMSGGTSYELLQTQIRQAMVDPRVHALLLDIDSPGGSVDGVQTVAGEIYAARNQKPIVAFANGQMASAAYWIGSAAHQIVAPPTAMVGSIGTRMVHRDLSGQDEQRGIKRTVIYSGKYKNVGSDAGPLSPADREELQAISDTYYDLFVEGVAQNRGRDSETVHDKMGDGKTFIGKKALKAGLIDQIGTFAEALALAREKGGSMVKNLDKARLQAENPDLYEAIRAEGAAGVTLETILTQQPQAAEPLRAEAREAGVQAERARTVKILARAGLKGVTLELIQGGAAYETALEQMVSHLDQMKAETLKALGTQSPPVLGTDPVKIESYAEPSVSAPIETRAKAEWDKDPKLQQEYGGRFETFLAYQRAKEEGRVKEITKS